MQFKPTKGKVLISLIPVYLLVFILPIALDLYDTSVSGLKVFFYGVGMIFYVVFTGLILPFTWLFEATGLGIDFGVLPEISLFGLILLALIYSSLLYLLISFFQKKLKN